MHTTLKAKLNAQVAYDFGQLDRLHEGRMRGVVASLHEHARKRKRRPKLHGGTVGLDVYAHEENRPIGPIAAFRQQRHLEKEARSGGRETNLVDGGASRRVGELESTPDVQNSLFAFGETSGRGRRPRRHTFDAITIIICMARAYRVGLSAFGQVMSQTHARRVEQSIP